MPTLKRLLPSLLLCAVVSACGEESPTAFDASPTRTALAAASTTTELIEGQMAPDLSAFDVSGAPVALSDFSGSYVLLEVGGGWCVPSRLVAPFLPVVDAAITADGTAFASVSVLIDDANFQVSTAGFTQAWLDAFYGGAYHPVLHMNGSSAVRDPWAQAVLGPYGALPILFLLGPDGTVLRVQVGASPTAEQLEAWVREGIAQGGSPSVDTIDPPAAPFLVGTPTTVSGTWSAPDEDVHSGFIEWGDGTSDPITVNDDGTWSSPAHTYSDIGFVSLRVTISDDAGASDTATLQDVLVVDPNGGFVVGVGSVISPAGSCFLCPDQADAPARFRLLSRYRKGASTPSGDFVFRFESGAFEFESTSQDWLLVNRGGERAQVKGVGRIVGGPLAADYPVDLHFMVRLDDGTPDGFALRIWVDDPAFGEDDVYDSFGSLPLASGNVMVKAGR